ncbi:hypothetical protein VTG60DRAFT_4578 [Thermothelomyces hinnuleus]
MAANVVLRTPPDLDKPSEQGRLKRLGNPVRDKVHPIGPKTTSAPEQVVQPLDLTHLSPSYLTILLRFVDFDQIIDFGKPLLLGIPPNSGFNLGTSPTSLAPKVNIDGSSGTASDIWALGYTLFHRRAVVEDIFDNVIGGSPPGL